LDETHLIQTCTLNSHLYTVTYTRCHTDTVNSPDDGHMAARSMQRIEINIQEKELCVKLVTYKEVTIFRSAGPAYRIRSDIIFQPEDGCSRILQTSGPTCQTTWWHKAEGWNTKLFM